MDANYTALFSPHFSIILLAPLRNLPNQLQRERLAVGELDRALAGLVLCQPGGKRLHRLRAGVQADVPLGRRKLDQVPALPVGGHTPGDFFFGLRDAAFDGVIYLMQIGLNILRLAADVFLNRLRRFPAVMVLIFPAK